MKKKNQKGRKPLANCHLRRAVKYARVSSREQEKEGYSIPAQLRTGDDYALQNTIDVVETFIDVETAKCTGRAEFTRMVRFLRKNPSIRIIIVEKTDRLYRNIKDFLKLDELDVEIHFFKEGSIISNDSRSTEKFMHGIRLLMAKQYIDNLSEEVKKGMQEKAEQGYWPTKAPLGYRNVENSDKQRVIVPDPQIAPLIVKIFEWYAAGDVSMDQVAELAYAAGFRHRRSGGKVPTSTIEVILRKMIYAGEYMWNGVHCKGRHEPLISPP